MSNELAVTPNPFAQKQRGSAVVAAAEVEQQRAIAEVQAAMMLARRFPRDQIAATDRILNACQRKTLAEGALYSYSKGGADVTGPSIRLAEAIAQNWGNIQFGIRELDQAGGMSTVEAFCWDVETNTRQVKVFQVPHIRHTRSGAKKLDDPRDIYELVANQGARRVRACILGVVPGDVVEAAVQQCETTMRASADTSPEAIKKLLSAFEAFGVKKEQIEARIQCRVEAIRPAQVVSLRKIYASMKDGMSKADDWFALTDAQKAERRNPLDALEDSLAADAAFVNGDAPHDPDTGEVINSRPQARGGKAKAAPTLSPEAAAGLAALNSATTEAEVEAVWGPMDIETCRQIGAEAHESALARVRGELLGDG